MSTSEQAAALTNDILGQFARDGDENAMRLLASEEQPHIQPAASPPPAAEPPPAEAQPEPDQPELVEAAQASELDFSPRLSDELQALLDEPDFDEEAAAEIEAALEVGEELPDDPAAAKRLRALEKRNEYLEGRLIARERKGWVAENLDAYPLLKSYAKEDVEALVATSRRDFARQAANLNSRLERIVGPALADIAAMRQQQTAEGRAEGRAAAAAAWGAPPADPASGGMPAQAAAQAELEAARARRAPLHERLKILARINNPMPVGREVQR